MLNAIITILISLNIQYSVLDNQSLRIKHDDSFILTNSSEFQHIKDSGINPDVFVIPSNDGPLDDIVIVPEIDPILND